MPTVFIEEYEALRRSPDVIEIREILKPGRLDIEEFLRRFDRVHAGGADLAYWVTGSVL